MNASTALLVIASLMCAPSVRAFSHAKIGSVLENVELTALDGSKQRWLSNATANVFVFFKPGQEHSRTTLTQLASCEREMASKSVHWVAIVSDRFSKSEVETMVKETGINMTVLVDSGDALYGKLGVVLCPVLGIADQDNKLVAYQHFTQVNFADVVRARLRFLLQEIDVRQLEQVLNPPRAVSQADTEKARVRLRLAERLFESKSYDKALHNVNQSLEYDVTLADAHALKGHVLLAQGNQEAARVAFTEALKLDSANASALEGLKASEK